MVETISVICPDCGNILIVNRKTGKILEVRRPLVEDSTGDRFDDAFKKAKRAEEEAERKFEEARQKEKDKMSRLDKIFKDEMERVKDEPIEKPLRDIDLD
jgi:Zn-finger nucleic acid-binding protein